MDEKQFRHKGLRELFMTGKSSKVAADLQSRALMALDALAKVKEPDELDIYIRLRHHVLKGARAGVHSLTVSGNWRITFQWDDGPCEIDLEDYH